MRPPELVVATDGTVELHTPPIVASASGVVAPTQTELLPVMVPPDGKWLMTRLDGLMVPMTADGLDPVTRMR